VVSAHISTTTTLQQQYAVHEVCTVLATSCMHTLTADTTGAAVVHTRSHLYTKYQ
jgi:hypothetical protein